MELSFLAVTMLINDYCDLLQYSTLLMIKLRLSKVLQYVETTRLRISLDLAKDCCIQMKEGTCVSDILFEKSLDYLIDERSLMPRSLAGLQRSVGFQQHPDTPLLFAMLVTDYCEHTLYIF